VQLEVVATDSATEGKVHDLCMKHTNVTRVKRELSRLVSPGHVVFLLLPKMLARACVSSPLVSSSHVLTVAEISLLSNASCTISTVSILASSLPAPNSPLSCLISGFGRDVDETCAVLGYCAAYSGRVQLKRDGTR